MIQVQLSGVLDSALTGYGPSHVDIALTILLESEDGYGYVSYWNRSFEWCKLSHMEGAVSDGSDEGETMGHCVLIF